MDRTELERHKKRLAQNGRVLFEVNKEQMSLEEIAGWFGQIVPGDKGVVVQSLLAQDKGNGSYGSFTFKVGFDEFPWHTDTAYWETPARFLLLTSDKPSSCATIARSFDSLRAVIEDFDYLAERSVFMLNIPGRRKLLSPVLKAIGFTGYRFDYNIYKPMNREANVLYDVMKKELKKEHDRVIWTGNNVLIIDNWKFIHSREDASQDKGRSLKRIYIDELV